MTGVVQAQSLLAGELFAAGARHSRLRYARVGSMLSERAGEGRSRSRGWRFPRQRDCRDHTWKGDESDSRL